MLPIIQGIVSALLTNNLPKVAQAVIDKGLDAVEEKLGVKLEPNMTPEQIEKVRQEAQKHEEFRIAQDNANTANARQMQEQALKQEDIFSKRFIYYFAAFWSVFTASYIAAITFMTVPVANQRVTDTVLGFLLGTLIATIINFFFGSSSGSREKTEMLGKIK